MDFIQFQLEEKMGDGSWAGVYDSPWEGEDRAYLHFESQEEARDYVNRMATQRGWRENAIERGAVRVVRVQTTRTVVLPHARPPAYAFTPLGAAGLSDRVVEGCPDCKPGHPCYGHGHGF